MGDYDEKLERASNLLQAVVEVFEENHVNGNTLRKEVLDELWNYGVIPLDPFAWADAVCSHMTIHRPRYTTEKELVGWALNGEPPSAEEYFDEWFPITLHILRYRGDLTGEVDEVNGVKFLQTRFH